MVKKIFIALAYAIWAFPSVACVKFNTDEYWDSSQLVVVGLVEQASIFYRDEYPYLKYTISDVNVLKGKLKDSHNLKVVADSSVSPLKVGLSFIIFIKENGYVDYCTPTKVFESKWFDKSYVDFESKEQEAFIKEIRDLI